MHAARLQGCNVLAWWLEKKVMQRSVLHAKFVRQPSAKHMPSRGAMAIFAGMGCADRLRISAVSGIFRPCFFVFVWLKACSQSFHVCPQAQQMARGSTHTTAKTAHFGKRCNKEHAHWLPCPRLALQKQHLPCAGQAARFLFCVACFAPCSYCLCIARHTI